MSGCRWAGAVVLSLLAGVGSAAGQPAAGVAALKAALEGRSVTVKIDMPATSGGVDLHPQREPDIDAETYGARLKLGIAIGRGARVPITLVKVNEANIEVQLAGGGFGTRRDPFLYPLRSGAYVPPTPRERNLEYERDRTTDPKRRRHIEQELANLARQRAAAEVAESRRREVEYERRKSELYRLRLERGSRFNVWYPDKRLKQWVPSAEELLQTMSAYLDARDPRLASLRPGMTTADAYTALGFPTRRRPSREGELEASVDTWESARDILEVTFVSGVIVKFTSTSK